MHGDHWVRLGWKGGVLLLALGLLPVPAKASDVPLVDAMRVQQLDVVARLIQSGADVNKAQPDGATALQWAAYHDDLDSAALLLRSGAHPDQANDYGMTPLVLAARNGSASMLSILLAGGADPNLALPTGQTALMTAAQTGVVAAVEALLARGADPNALEQSHGQTALMWAIADGHIDVVRSLVAGGAAVELASSSGFTPLMFAARGGSVELARFLIEHGADIRATAHDGTSVLHVATVRGHVPLALELLERGADPNGAGPGYTPLHWAAGIWETAMTYDYDLERADGEWKRLGGLGDQKLVMVNALLAAGADPNARITGMAPRFGNPFGMPPVAGATPFFLAAQAHDREVMQALVDGGADPTLRADRETTPLMAAAMMYRETGSSHLDEAGGIAAAALCLQLGNDIDAVNAEGDTALHSTVLYGWADMAEFLLENGANPSPVNNRGQTPLRNALGVVRNAMFREQPAVAAVLRRYNAVAPEVDLDCGVCPPPVPAGGAVAAEDGQ